MSGSTSIRIQPSFVAGELSPRLWGRVDLDKYAAGCSELTNMVVMPQGGLCNRPGLRYVATTKTSAKASRLVPFQYSTTVAYVLEFGHNYIRFYTEGAQVVDGSGNPVEVTTTYTEAELPYLRFAQSADVLFICHKNHAPAMLSRVSATSFTLANVTWTWPVFNSENVSDVTVAVNKASVGTGRTMTFSSSAFSKGGVGLTASHVGMYIYAYEYTGSPAVASAKGLAIITAVTDANHATVTIIKAFNSTGATAYWAEGSFNAVYGYPRLVTFFEDRLVFAGNEEFPERIWLSQTGDYYNFEYGTSDNDAIARSINAEQVNALVWLKSAKRLYYGTRGGEGHLSSGDSGSALTPSNVTTKTESRYGSPLEIDPLLIGNETIFVQRPGKTLRRYAYDYISDSFLGENLSIMAEHLTMGNNITEIAYQQEPHSVVWCVRDDGALLGMTYMPEHKVVAWHKHETDGVIESVCTIPGDSDDEVWLIVARTVGGATVRYVELMDPFFNGAEDESEDAFFVDSGLSYDGSSATTFSGLDHLIGETVAVLADGAVQANRVVNASGQITLDYAASKVHAGLPYTCDVVTMPIPLLTQDGGLAAHKFRIVNLALRFYNTYGCKVSSDGATFNTVHFPLVDNAIKLYTGDHVINFPGGFDRYGLIHIRQDIPLPFTLLAIMPEIQIDK